MVAGKRPVVFCLLQQCGKRCEVFSSSAFCVLVCSLQNQGSVFILHTICK